MAEQLEHAELFDECILKGHSPKWKGRGGVNGVGIKVAVCKKCGKVLKTFIKDFNKKDE